MLVAGGSLMLRTGQAGGIVSSREVMMRMAVRETFENHMGDQILVCGLSGLSLGATLGKLLTAAILLVPKA